MVLFRIFEESEIYYSLSNINFILFAQYRKRFLSLFILCLLYKTRSKLEQITNLKFYKYVSSKLNENCKFDIDLSSYKELKKTICVLFTLTLSWSKINDKDIYYFVS